MDIHRKTRMQVILADEENRAVLEWYGLPINDRRSLRHTLEDFCATYEVDVEDILLEFAVAQDELEEETWLFI